MDWCLLMLTRNVAQDGEQDVDQEISAAAALEEHSDRGQEDGEDDLDDVSTLDISMRASLSQGMKEGLTIR